MSKGFARVVQSKPPRIIKKLKRSVIQEFGRLEEPRTKREPKHLVLAQVKNWQGINYSYSEKTEAGHQRKRTSLLFG